MGGVPAVRVKRLLQQLDVLVCVGVCVVVVVLARKGGGRGGGFKEDWSGRHELYVHMFMRM